MEEIKARKFVLYAKESLNYMNKGNEEMELINAFGFIMKGFHSQIDELVRYFKEFRKPKKELKFFPDKFDFVKNSNIKVPEQILRLIP